MLLKFYPKRGTMPKWPGKGAGSYPYVGRVFDAETRANRATKEPAGVVAFDKSGRMTEECRRLAFDLCKRDGDLLPADEATAKFCGVEFAALKQDADGEWGPAPAAAPKSLSSAKGGE